MKKKLYSIIMAHFNQEKYIKDAIDSVLIQDYQNIELIIFDDCSINFKPKEIEKYIKENNKGNIKAYKVIKNAKNLGTTKSLNNALKYVNGHYVQFFAADDALYDEKVVSTFVKELDKCKGNVITAQCLMYDENLFRSYAEGINAKKALKLNSKLAIEQYKTLTLECTYGAGGTAYKTELFTKVGKFCEKYKLVEDWAYWLYITRKGEKIIYSDFKALKHREGGVSEQTYSSKKVQYQVNKDILKIYKRLIFSNFDSLSLEFKKEILETYSYYVNIIKDYNIFKYYYFKIFIKIKISELK